MFIRLLLLPFRGNANAKKKQVKKQDQERLFK